MTLTIRIHEARIWVSNVKSAILTKV